MPRATTYSESKAVKLLFIGDSGTGKTGALASLVEAGYTLAILDFDNGLDYLVNHLRMKPNAAELLNRVYYETCTDKFKAVAGQMIPSGVPKAFTQAMNLLTNWKTDDYDFGPLETWPEDRILVIDSLTFMSNAAFRHVDSVNHYKDPRQTYGEAQERIENVLALLYSDEVPCPVIVNSHVTFVELDTGLTKGYPSSVGKALGPKIPRYFNTCLGAKTKGSGASSKRVILTRTDGLVDLKAALPAEKLPAELPIETGLADFFKLMKQGA